MNRLSSRAQWLAGGLLLLLLAACGGVPGVTPPSTALDAAAPAAPLATADATLVDEQGAVSVAVTPLDLAAAGATIDFQVVMNTHSVELDMDLAGLATLETDGGLSLTPAAWDAASGGHHVSGVLSFPATVDGAPVLAGATRISLTIRGVDAPERVFAWALP